MQELSREKILRIQWGLPLEHRTYEEIGKVMAQVLPLVEKVELADSEGAVLRVRVYDGGEGIKELRTRLYYIDLWFEGEDPEVVRNERMERWAERDPEEGGEEDD